MARTEEPGADICSDAKRLLTPAEAAARVLATLVPIAGVETVPLGQARGRILRGTITAPRSLPPFDHSAVDGYALAMRAAVDEGAGFRLVGRVAAGRPMSNEVRPGDAVRIFTGAAIPSGCDAVVMQEHAEVSDGVVMPLRRYRAGDNIRLAGEDVPAGADLLPVDTVIDARHLALLAASGLSRVTVTRRLRVAVLSTGTELRAPGETLSEGAIYDSNRVMLLAMLDHPAIETIDAGIIPDDAAGIAGAVRDAAAKADLVVTSGGVSVGEEDLVRRSVEAVGGFLTPLKIGMKPGKPLAFGRIGNAAILGLPGNPQAALVGAMMIGRQVVAALAGMPAPALSELPAMAGFERRVTPGRIEFAPACITGRDRDGTIIVETLGRGGSARLMPLAAADGFCVIPADVEYVLVGDPVGFMSIDCLSLFAG
ncbi:gephyrin-like molybdotransferase Glp [Aurantimonas sp. C2-6-R+9]|uniref:molybdopterin molybdotransferase MoeA n=1 Tax=unclassified Aurantimonas TaxID=2638230 RepID=UPI002E17F3A4|nr:MULTISPECIES: gephyrin-like molybdotransferase Glp [unclassified Aurantimonas]MEC5292881.1 gephyrin-like molybdotransferase Glp [Aurantimonas sp. C2-3-R2]MEC5383114.1 gephyrin-like molybdotransferase Glp [Aurantimonas sp. C2-6-R+9]MEC5413931.1 gephyrin-like molybdotransferase Glp [Aurantimonas sp. C2-4-R8]